ncbi:MAG: hypothetical protein ACK5JF_03825 [Oscillospiraceae bacterium]
MASTYSDYDFYKSVGGALTEAEYNASVHEAKYEIDFRTFERAATAPAEMAEKIKMCECKLVDAIHSYKKTYELLPNGIASISNDGFSVSAGARADSGTSTASAEQSAYQSICLKYLSLPINLMFAGGCWC